MGRFDDYQKVADPLILSINGHDYVIPEVGMQDGIRLSTQEEEDAEPISNEDFRRMLLGDVYDRMVTDNAPASAVMRAVTTAYADFTRGREMAELVWKTGGDPKAVEQYVKSQAPNRASRRSTGTASARKTPSRVSTNATKASPTSK